MPQNQKYLHYQYQQRAGLDHKLFDFRIFFKEAVMLDRTAVLPNVKLARRHNKGHAIYCSIARYVNLDRVYCYIPRATQPIRYLRWIDKESFDFKQFAPQQTLITDEIMISRDDDATYPLIVRNLIEIYAMWKRVCVNYKHDVEACVVVPPSNKILSLSDAVISSIRDRHPNARTQPNKKLLKLPFDLNSIFAIPGNYACLHVRGNDKGAKFRFWQQAAEPKTVFKKVRGCLPEGAQLYFMSDNPHAPYLELLSPHYRVATYRDFPELQTLVEGHAPDNFMLYAVEKKIMQSAAYKIYSDPKFTRERVS